MTDEASGAKEGKKDTSAQTPVSFSGPGPWKDKADHTEDNLCFWLDSELPKGGVPLFQAQHLDQLAHSWYTVCSR